MLKNKNSLAYLFSILMISLGSTLEVYFYIYRFLQDNIHIAICSITSAALTLLMSLAVYKSEEKKRWIILVVFVGLFSIISTSAGQTFSLLSKENDGIQEAVDNSSSILIESLNENLESLSAEAKGINQTLAGIDTIEKEAMYRTTVNQARDRLQEISTEKLSILSLIAENNTATSESKKENLQATSIYSFYGSIGEWSKTDWIKFGFHTVLSILIALMSPVGILTWPKKNLLTEGLEGTQDKKNIKVPAETKKPNQKRPKMTVSMIREYIHRSFFRVSKKVSDFIIPKDVFFNFTKTKELEYPEDVYDYLSKKCVELKIFDIRGLVLIKDEEAAVKIIVENLKKTK